MTQQLTEQTPPKYEYVDSPINEDVGAIKILEGEFAGLVYQYGKAQFNEREDGQCELNFQFTAFDHDNHPKDIDLKSKDLYNVLGHILMEVLEEHLDETEQEATRRAELEEVPDNKLLEEQIEDAKTEIEKNRNENS